MSQSEQSQPVVVGYSHENAWNSGFLKVDDIHQLYYEEYGNKEGKPVIFLHGGPGGQTSKGNTEYFNPSIYRVVLLDQRGAGKSTPNAELRDNTTWHLVEDIDTLRKHLNIQKWHLVFGGSWGSTLALCYAQQYPDLVGALVLRGVFTMRESEVEWIRNGARQIFPEYYEKFITFLPEEERDDYETAYNKRLTSDDRATALAAARSWNMWEESIGTLLINLDTSKLEDEEWLLAHARFEAHYTVHKGWMKDGHILEKENIEKIKHIPTTIVQGRYDMVCPPQTAWDLHKALPESKLIWSPAAGHSANEPGTKQRLIDACDEFAKL